MTPAGIAVARCLRAAREAAGKTQRQMAEAVGVSTQQWGKYERFENRISSGIVESAYRFLEIETGGRPGSRSPGFSDLAPARYESSSRTVEADLVPALAALAAAIVTVQDILHRAVAPEAFSGP